MVELCLLKSHPVTLQQKLNPPNQAPPWPGAAADTEPFSGVMLPTSTFSDRFLMHVFC